MTFQAQVLCCRREQMERIYEATRQMWTCASGLAADVRRTREGVKVRLQSPQSGWASDQHAGKCKVVPEPHWWVWAGFVHRKGLEAKYCPPSTPVPSRNKESLSLRQKNRWEAQVYLLRIYMTHKKGRPPTSEPKCFCADPDRKKQL